MKFTDISKNSQTVTEMVGYNQGKPTANVFTGRKPAAKKNPNPFDKSADDKRSQLQRMKDAGKKNWYAIEGQLDNPGAEESEIQRREMGESGSRSALGKAIRSSNIISEAAKGHTVEAHGVKGMNNKAWRKTFKNAEQAYAWAEKNDAEVKGTRDLEAAKTGNLSPAVKEGAKTDRMVKHITKSEKAAGKSSAAAEDIAWATANKRGMLDNKNKKTESTKARANKKY